MVPRNERTAKYYETAEKITRGTYACKTRERIHDVVNFERPLEEVEQLVRDAEAHLALGDRVREGAWVLRKFTPTHVDVATVQFEPVRCGQCTREDCPSNSVSVKYDYVLPPVYREEVVMNPRTYDFEEYETPMCVTQTCRSANEIPITEFRTKTVTIRRGVPATEELLKLTLGRRPGAWERRHWP